MVKDINDEVAIVLTRPEIRELFRRIVWQAGPSKRKITQSLREKITEAHLKLNPPSELEHSNGEESSTDTSKVPNKPVRGRKRSVRGAKGSGSRRQHSKA